MLKTISRDQLDTTAWDTCVATAQSTSVYGFSWYLDAVLPAPDWRWVGIVQVDEGGVYRAVMPVPLRRKKVVGIPYEWVVHQPFFCPFLSIFSSAELPDSTLFVQQMVGQFRYGSVYRTQQSPGSGRPATVDCQVRSTHTIDLSAGYESIYANYTRDRKLNLRRARHACKSNRGWALVDSADVEPLLVLFRTNHARAIDGGVADWAYEMLRNLVQALHKRGLCTLRYAVCNGQIEAGVLFICHAKRITYLFNAASETGRRANARTMLIDQLIQEKAGRELVLDFESPEKASIRQFYQSFGAIEEPFWTLRWNRLRTIEKLLRTGWRYIEAL